MRKTKNQNVYFLSYGAVIAAVYVVLTVIFQPISFGPVQFRIAEALCILPYFTSAAIPGVFVGCLLSNLLCGAAGLDIVFGSLATLLGAAGTYALRSSKRLACLPPILANTVVIPWVLRYAYGSADLIPVAMLTVGVGEILAVGVLGTILRLALERHKTMIFGSCLALNRKVQK